MCIASSSSQLLKLRWYSDTSGLGRRMIVLLKSVEEFFAGDEGRPFFDGDAERRQVWPSVVEAARRVRHDLIALVGKDPVVQSLDGGVCYRERHSERVGDSQFNDVLDLAKRIVVHFDWPDQVADVCFGSVVQQSAKLVLWRGLLGHEH